MLSFSFGWNASLLPVTAVFDLGLGGGSEQLVEPRTGQNGRTAAARVQPRTEVPDPNLSRINNHFHVARRSITTTRAFTRTVNKSIGQHSVEARLRTKMDDF